MAIQDPHSFSDLDQGQIEHIALEIEVDFSSRTLEILTRYRFHQPVSGSLFLDTRGLEIERIEQAGSPVSWALDEEDRVLGQRLHLHDLDQADEIAIRSRTSPEAMALQWLTPAQTAGGRHPFLFSQCQALNARSTFPCQDSPSVRFTYDASLTVPDPLTAVMAAEKVGQESRNGSTTFTYRMPQPIPSYLFALAVGDLDFKAIGPRTGVYAEPEIVEAAAWEFGENERKLELAEGLLGPYLWGRYDVLVMPPSFPFGGMENPRLTFMNPTTIVGDRSQTDVITHELAHAWTGNLVTNATWNDFWLNEGWTTYAESRLTELMEGEDINQLFRHREEALLQAVMNRLGYESELTCLKTSLVGQDPAEILTKVPYVKGMNFILLLERAAGRKAFDTFIRSYIDRFQFSSLTTEDFLAYLEQQLPEAAREVDIGAWVYQPGYPEDAPVPQSALYDAVEDAYAAYKQGVRPQKASVESWHRDQVFLFLNKLKPEIPVEDCRYFEDLFDLKHRDDAGLQSAFYEVAIPSGYQEIRPGLEDLVEHIGRLLYLMPVFRAMSAAEWTRPFARSLFETYRARHHPITSAAIDRVLTKAGL
jgi:leukotriene-A4 hydrolase